MKSYHRLMLGRKHVYAAECLAGGFVGTDFGIHEDLSRKLPDDWRAFNKAFIPVYLAQNPEKTKVSAGLACGAIHTVAKGMQKGDIVLCPERVGSNRAGEVLGDYYYAEGQILPHRRKVRWLDGSIDRAAMSEALRNSTGSIGTVSNISAHREAAKSLGVPGAISFTVETDGKLPSGDVLATAIEQVDLATDSSPAYYMINCAHPSHFENLLATDVPWLRRLVGIRANASRKRHAELDSATELDAGDPLELAQHYRVLRARLRHLSVLGGCCGTDLCHILAIGRACLLSP